MVLTNRIDDNRLISVFRYAYVSLCGTLLGLVGIVIDVRTPEKSIRFLVQRNRVFHMQNVNLTRHQHLQEKHVDKVLIRHDVLVNQLRCIREAMFPHDDVLYKEFTGVKAYTLGRNLGIELNLRVADGREISLFQYGQYLQTTTQMFSRGGKNFSNANRYYVIASIQGILCISYRRK